MTHPIYTESALAKLSAPERSNDLPLVTLKANHWGDKWELSIADKKIGTVEKVPSWLTDETFEGNPSHVYECHPYGLCITQAEAIGRLFAGWLVELKIADPQIWTAELRGTGLDYM